jgi:hypothetical protein
VSVCPCDGGCPRCVAEIQPKLTISRPNDKYEQEADSVAEQVMRMPEPQVQRKACSSPDCKEKDEEEKKLVQAKPAGGREAGAQADHPLIRSVLSSPGQPLDAAARSFMEPRFGQDFSGVRVHTGSEAAGSARAVNARAYTVGRDVLFGEGEYAPGSSEGQKLMAHELTHVIQQSSGDLRLDRKEDEEDETTAQVAQQRICGPDITASLTTMLGTVGPWFRGLSTFRKHRSCVALGPAAPLVGVNPIMAWDTRELYLPNTGWLDAYFRRRSCGSPRDAGCNTDPTRRLCETAGSCGNSVVVGGKCLLAGTANYALFGTMCRLCHDETSQWGRWDMRAIIGAYKTITGDDSTPPKEVASAAYDGTFPTLPAAAENRRTCTGRCGLTHGGAFDFIWEPYKPR